MGFSPWSIPNIEIFEKLEKGTEIVLLPGAGYPSNDEFARVLIVLEVDQFSALTIDGTKIGCQDAPKIYLTGTMHENVQPSSRAQEIVDAVRACRAAEDEYLI